tara:strand:- start:338 stop:1198 length:861 start_codon:yes stop_codon:yes gene_type:complete
MIEKIFIPTVNRPDSQLTYNNLPDALKKITVMVVQAWERDQYDYPCEYLVLPDTDEYHFDHYYCLPKTRKFIYETGQDMKYAVLDDDLVFIRRNAKYWTGISNMEMSKKTSTEEDILEMFEKFSGWLDLDTVTICGCGPSALPPIPIEYRNNSFLYCGLWINGSDFKHELHELDLTSIKIAEDVFFLLQMLDKGYGNRQSNEFAFLNSSVHKKDYGSTCWDKQSFDDTHKDHKYIEQRFPNTFNVLYDENGERTKGGFRDYGRTKVKWGKTFKPRTNTLGAFLDDA